MNKVAYCEKCHQKRQREKELESIDGVKDRLNKIFGEDVDIDLKCQSLCGPGKKSPFIVIDDEPYIVESQEEIYEISEEVK